MKRILLFIGMLLLILALSGFVTLSTRTFPRVSLESDAAPEAMSLPPSALQPEAVTPSPSPPPTQTPTPTPALPDTTTPEVVTVTITTPPPPPTPGQNCQSGTWKVEPGQTLSEIAKICQVPLETLLAYNNIRNANDIGVGDVLFIPPPSSAPCEAGVWVVGANQTLSRIASTCAVGIDELAEANDLADPDVLGVGQVLVIPPVTPTGAGGPVATPTPIIEVTGESTEEPITPTPLVEPVTGEPPEPGQPTPVPGTPTPTPTPPPTPTPESLPPETIEATSTPIPATPETRTVVEVEWPARMEVNRSDTIRITMVRTAEDTYTATVEVEEHAAVVETPIPVGTPGAPVGEAFGPQYRAFATASLTGTTFDISPATAIQRQPLDRDRITWEWNITTDKPGSQVLNAEIIVDWEPIGEEGETIEPQQVWSTRLEIPVNKPFIATGQLSILSLAGSFLGSGLSIPWMYDRFKELRKPKAEKTDKTESSG